MCFVCVERRSEKENKYLLLLNVVDIILNYLFGYFYLKNFENDQYTYIPIETY